MPIQYKVFGCKFKCGRRRVQARNIIIDHEITCWYNPKNKTCKSCVYEDYGIDFGANEQDSWFTRDCRSPDPGGQLWVEEAFEEHMESMDKNPGGQIPPATHCPYWKNKNKKEK